MSYSKNILFHNFASNSYESYRNLNAKSEGFGIAK